jgi:hypothetical protein
LKAIHAGNNASMIEQSVYLPLWTWPELKSSEILHP